MITSLYVSPTTRYDRRLLFKDLNENSILNGVNTGELLTLWTPELQFLNALGPYQTIVDDLNVCTILYEKAPTYDDITESVECKKIFRNIIFRNI